MKKVIVIFLYLLFNGINSGQVPIFENNVPTYVTYNYGDGGYKLPSVGSIHILLVFAEFPDDSYDVNNSRWVKGQSPTNMNNWVDATWSTNPTQGSLTHYFNDMSNNNLKITGKEIHAIAPHTRNEYYSMSPIKRRGAIQKEIIQQIDITEDFSVYDNWGLVADYNQTNTPDGKVDMIVFVWRNTYQDDDSYVSSLDFGNNYGDLGWVPTYYVDGGARYVNTYNWGSGVSVRGYLQTEKYLDPFRLVTHEFAHYLLGGNDMHNGYAFWGLLSDWGIRTCVANAFERYQLNWIDDPSGELTIDATSSSIQTLTKTLSDIVTSKKAIRITVNSATNEYFYVENHTGTSYWETHTPFAQNPNIINGYIEPGIYVIRQNGLNYYQGGQYKKMLIPADGRFAWEVNGSITNPWGSGIYPLWEKGSPDRINGYHTLEKVPHSYPTGENPGDIIFKPLNVPPFWEYISEHNGDAYDAFKMDYNEVFSPWSNPNNQRENKSTVNFAMELDAKSTNGDYTLKFYVNNPEDGSPSKPQNIKIVWNNNHPKITWDSNTEPDMKEYKIWKYAVGSAMVVATVTHSPSISTHTWTDNSVSPAGKFDPVYTYSYKVKAVDNSNLESLYSNQVSISGTGGIWKINGEEDTNTDITSYALDSNYPNPFNPTTQISYQLPENSFVNLGVYNALGQKVEELVNQHQSSGKYTVKFDASNLPSGIYFYKIESGSFSKSMKMLLLK